MGAFLPFTEAHAIAVTLGVHSKNEWNALSKAGRLPPGMPSAPPVIYKANWLGWRFWLSGAHAPRHATLHEAMAYAKAMKIVSEEEWRYAYGSGRLPEGMPAIPSSFFGRRGEWRGYPYFFGRTDRRKKKWLPFTEAREIARSMNLKDKEAWTCSSIFGERPEGVPSNPDVVYASEWMGWRDWLDMKKGRAHRSERAPAPISV
jgi:hypothetical protein